MHSLVQVRVEPDSAVAGGAQVHLGWHKGVRSREVDIKQETPVTVRCALGSAMGTY